jgi:small multidrug resistance pump
VGTDHRLLTMVYIFGGYRVANYVVLMGAILLEVAGTLMLPMTNNFSKIVPTVFMAGLYAFSFYLLTFAIKTIPLPVVYATWSGVGVFLVALLSYIMQGDILRWPAILGLFFIVIGVMLVNLYSGAMR